MVSLFITSGAMMKFANTPEMLARYTRMGMQHQMALFAIAEVMFTGLFLYPKTMKIGFLLLTAYFGGAIGVELLLGNLFIFPAVILTVIWIAAYCRNPYIFKPLFSEKKYSLR